MRGLNGRAIVTRVKGRGALTKSLVRLLLRANRFASQRARTRDDQVWAGRFIDSLTVALRVARETAPIESAAPAAAAVEHDAFELVAEATGDAARRRR